MPMLSGGEGSGGEEVPRIGPNRRWRVELLEGALEPGQSSLGKILSRSLPLGHARANQHNSRAAGGSGKHLGQQTGGGIPGAPDLVSRVGGDGGPSRGGLAAPGIGPGKSIALYLPNTPYHPLCFFALARTGARIVPLSALDARRGLAHKLQDSGARLLVTTDFPELLPNARWLLETGAVDRVLVGEDAHGGTRRGPTMRTSFGMRACGRF